MAEPAVDAGKNRRRGIARSKKLSTRVDLTPMVDLGFLLITFFVFTTTVSQPREMKILMPAGEIANTEVPESKLLTIIPLSGDSVFYYHGSLNSATQKGHFGFTNFSVTEGIGKVIREKQQWLEVHPSFKKSDLTLIIHPSDDASYQSVVNALDEVFINLIGLYFFGDLTQEEKTFVKNRR